jgi:hypothetical protein
MICALIKTAKEWLALRGPSKAKPLEGSQLVSLLTESGKMDSWETSVDSHHP